MYATFVPGISKRLDDILYHANTNGPKALFESGIHVPKGQPLYEYYVEKIFLNWFESIKEITFSSKDYRRKITVPAPLDGIYYVNTFPGDFFSWRSKDLEKINAVSNPTFDELSNIDFVFYVITNKKTLITAYEVHEPWFRFMKSNWPLIHSWLASSPHSYDLDKIQTYLNSDERELKNIVCPCVQKAG